MIVTSTSTQRFKNITDEDLNKIINSNKIINYTKRFYADAVIKHTVRWNVHITGLPYFKLQKILPDLKKTKNNNNKEDLKIEDFITSSATQDDSLYYHNRRRHNDRLLSLHDDGIKEEEKEKRRN